MTLLTEIKQTYADYIGETQRLQATRKFSDGLLGFGRGPASDACHDRFTDRLEVLLKSEAAVSPSPRDAGEILTFMFEEPLKNRDNTLAYWMLLAVHTLTADLITQLPPEDAAALSARYQEAYPKSTRLPAQKKIAKLLQEKAGSSGRGGIGFFSRFRR